MDSEGSGRESVTRPAYCEGREIVQETEMNWTKRNVSVFNEKIDLVCAYRDDSVGVWRMWDRKGRVGNSWPFCTSRVASSSIVRGER